MKRSLVAVPLVVAAAALTMTACSSSEDDIEGTYYGTSGQTELLIAPDGKCAYSEDYKPGKNLNLKPDGKCTWTLKDKKLTFGGILPKGSLKGTVDDKGIITLPDQQYWSGEAFEKK